MNAITTASYLWFIIIMIFTCSKKPDSLKLKYRYMFRDPWLANVVFLKLNNIVIDDLWCDWSRLKALTYRQKLILFVSWHIPRTLFLISYDIDLYVDNRFFKTLFSATRYFDNFFLLRYLYHWTSVIWSRGSMAPRGHD